jgi:hypothetical protein
MVDSILTDYSTATKGSPENGAVVRLRIVAIILTTLAKDEARIYDKAQANFPCLYYVVLVSHVRLVCRCY